MFQAGTSLKLEPGTIQGTYTGATATDGAPAVCADVFAARAAAENAPKLPSAAVSGGSFSTEGADPASATSGCDSGTPAGCVLPFRPAGSTGVSNGRES
jgi:hypothetical protein